MKISKRVWIVSGVVLAALAGAAVLYGGRTKPTEVETEPAAVRDLVERVTASGKIQPASEVSITAQVSGEILQLPVKEGDWVTKGTLLVVINPDLYESALNRALAGLNTARSNLATARAGLAQAETAFLAAKKAWTRAQQLHKERILSDADFDTAESTYRAAEAGEKSAREAVAAGGFAIESAQASVQEARDNLSRTILRAPQDGTITALAKEVGESVQGTGFMAGEIIMKVSDLGAMEVHVEVNESDIVRVGLGDSVDVEVDAYRETTFKGTVVEIGNTALNATGAAGLGMDQVTNFSVKIRIDPASYAALAGSDSAASPFRPGMSATVEILTDRASGALSVPLQAVTTRGEGDESTTGVFVSSDGKAVWTPVRTGLQDSRHIVVVSGLEAAAEVITGPYETISRSLTDGDAITTGKKDDAAPVP